MPPRSPRGAGREHDRKDLEAFAAGMRNYFASLPSDRFPNLISLAGQLTEGDNDARFEFGLDVLVRGLAAMPA